MRSHRVSVGELPIQRVAILKHILRSMHRMMQSSGTAEGLRGLIDSSILKSIKKIVEYRGLFGPNIFPLGKTPSWSISTVTVSDVQTLQPLTSCLLLSTMSQLLLRSSKRPVYLKYSTERSNMALNLRLRYGFFFHHLLLAFFILNC